MDDEYENEFEPLPAQEADRSLDDAELEDANPTEEAEAEMEESRELQATTSDWADAEDADVNQDELEDSPPGPDDPIGPDPAEEHPVSPGSPESMEEPPPPSAARSHQDGATNDIPAPDADQPVAPSLAAEEEQSSPARTEQDLARADDTHVPDAEQPDAPAQEAVEEPSSPSRTDHENERSDNGPAPDTQHSATPSQERMEETSPSRTDHENERPDDTPVPDTEQPAASNPETKDEPSSPARTDHQIHHNERPEDTPVPASAAAESPISPDQASSRVEAPAGSRDPKHESPGEKAKQDASPKASEVAPISEPGQTRKASNGRNGRTRSAPNGSIRQGAYKATIDLPPKWSMRGKTSFGSPFKSSKQADEGGMAGDMSSKYNEIRPRAPAWSMIPRSSGITKTADQPGPGEYPQPSTLYGSHPQLPVPGRICKSTQNRTGPTDQVGEMKNNPSPQDYNTVMSGPNSGHKFGRADQVSAPKFTMRAKVSFGSQFKSSKQADEGGMAGDMSSKYNEIRPRAPAWSMIPRSSGITKTADQPGPGEYPQPSTLYGSHPQLPVPGRICKSTQRRTGPTDQVGEMMRNPGPQDYYT